MIDLKTFFNLFIKVITNPKVLITLFAVILVIDFSYRIVNYRRRKPKLKKKMIVVNKPKENEQKNEAEESEDEK
ncbi:MAG: hypothetical protein IKX23_05405 [Treponema sp.]|nr:hypothetical protein [Treponema sp.]